ncbi:type IV secretory system conjugative DNA transfer family protein, partial [Campylobacter coli]|nr:type IV secretory system conjugative DNA transfer family protein [Campylobacter coli]
PSAKKDKDDKIIAPGDMLIFIAGQAPIYGKQILYFKDPAFLARSKVTLDKQVSDIL